MNQVELGRVHESRVGRFFVDLYGRGRGFVEGGGVETVQNVASDVSDVITFVGGGSANPVASTPLTVTAPVSSVPVFQTRTSLAREKKTEELLKSAKLPLLIGAGALAAILLLRKK